MNIVTENSIKGILSKIASDIKNKVSVGDMGNYISDYFKNNTENNVDLETAVVDIINNNTNNISLESVLGDYYNKSEVNRLVASSGNSTSSLIYDISGFSKTSIEIANEMLIGYNIGNQFEAANRKNVVVENENIKDLSMFYETLWGNPKVTKEYIEYLASVGIQAIRLPATWGNCIDPNNNTILTNRLERIKYVIDLIINNGMYCILNVHHDGYRAWKRIVFEEGYYIQSMSYYTNLWSQIGDYFKDYGYKLLFESFNEVTNSVGSMTNNEEKDALAGKFNQAFINIIRSQGGNNTQRFLCLHTYSGVSLIRNATFQSLQDSAQDKLLISLNNYPTSEYGIKDVIVNCKNKRSGLSVGVLISEIGSMPASVEFAQWLRKYSDQYTIPTFWWDNGMREFNLVDRYHYEPTNDALAAYVGKAITRKAYTFEELMNDIRQPYCFKLCTPNANHVYNPNQYMIVCSQKPITSISTSGDSRGYYKISGNEGGVYTIYTSSDDIHYYPLESLLCNTTATILINTKHTLWGTTEETYFVDGNYTIADAPVQTTVVNVQNVSLDAHEVSLSKAGTITLIPTIIPINSTNKNATWTTSNSSVATVDNNGKVTAVEVGTANITVATLDGGFTDTCIINVIEEQSNPDNPQPIHSGKFTSDFIDESKLNLTGLNANSFEDKDDPLYSNRILFFADDFEGNSLNEDIYSISDKSEPNYGVCYFTNDGTIKVEDSVMKLVSTPTPFTSSTGKVFPYRGAQVVMNLEFQNCLFEAKIRNTKAEHWCNAIWTCGYSIKSHRSWSYCGEIDFFEDTDGNGGLCKHVTLHYSPDYSAHSVKQTFDVLNNDVYNTFKQSGNDGLWHIYGCELQNTGVIRFYFDHVPFLECNTTTQTYANDFNPFKEAQHFIWDCCAWTKAAEGEVSIETDWVRAWSLENETSEDLIPQSIQLVDTGSKPTITNGNQIEVGNFLQLKPVYTPSTVPMIMNMDAVKPVHDTLTYSDEYIDYRGGLGIKPIKAGEGTVQYTDLFGTTCTQTYNFYSRDLANGETNLENFDYNTEHYRSGRYYRPAKNQTPSQWSWSPTDDKSICFGTYKVTPSTTYELSYNRGGGEVLRLILLNENNVCTGTVAITTETTLEIPSDTHFIIVQYVINYSKIINELFHIHKFFVESYKLSFRKISNEPIDDPEEPIMSHATSEHISPAILNLNGLDETKFDDIANTSLYNNRILFFADDFDGDSLDENMYSIDEKADSANDCIYGRDGIEVQDSIVKMTTESRPKEYNGHTYQFKAGRFMTNFEFQNCLVESKIRNTRLQGKNEAFWTCGYSLKGLRSWAYCGEIDIFEDCNGNDGLNKYVTFHYNKDYETHSVDMPKTIIDNATYNLYKNSGDNEWHIYGCELSSSGIIKFYFDHVLFMEVDTTTRTYPNDFNPFKYAQHFIWEACTWNKNSEGTATIEVDWIRAWSLENKAPVDLIPQSVTLQDTGSKISIEDGNKIRTGTFVQLAPVYIPSTVPMIMNLDAVKATEFKTLDYPSEYIESKGGLGIKPIKDGKVGITYTDLFGVSCSQEYTGYSKSLANGETNLEDFDYLTDNYRYGRYELPAIGKPLTTWTLDRSMCFGLYKVEPLTEYNATFTNFGNPLFRVGILDNSSNVISKFNITSTDNLSFTTPENAAYILIQYTVNSSAASNELFHIHKLFIEMVKLSFTKENSTRIACTAINTNEEIEVDKSTQLEYSIEPIGCTDVVTFTSNNTSVATVDGNGVVRPISNGNTTVTITCGDISKVVKVTSIVNITSSYSLPSDLDTVQYEGKGALSENFPYHVLAHDKVNNIYRFLMSFDPLTKIVYASGKGSVYIGLPTGQTNVMTMLSDNPTLPNCIDYFAHYTDGSERVKKTSQNPISMGKYYFTADTERNWQAVTDVNDIEVLYANYSIEGFYTMEDIPCTDIQLNDTLEINISTRLPYKTKPYICSDPMTFTSSNTSVLTVSDTGYLYPISNGEADITMTCGSVTKTCKVTVIIPEKDMTNKTIVRSNYSPNGEEFADENIAWNKNTDTIFVSFTDDNTTEKQSVFTVANTATNVGKWATGTIQTCYRYDSDNTLEFSALINGQVLKRIPITGNRVKMAINKDNIYINGVAVLENGVWHKDLPKEDISSAKKTEWNKIMNNTKIAIGSKEGSIRSFANYEEISIHHNLYTSTEMQQLTTV